MSTIRKLGLIISIAGGLSISPAYADLPLEYIKDHAKEFIEGTPETTIHYNNEDYNIIHRKKQEALFKVEETTVVESPFPLSPTVFYNYDSYQVVDIQLPNAVEVWRIGIGKRKK